MIIATTIQEVRDRVSSWKRDGKTIGLVPTMGYLHEGHASLIKKSSELCDVTVVSVFVNPTQFGAGEDLDSYPRDFERDLKICEDMGATLCFHPEVTEMYPDGGTDTYVEILDDMPKVLCGKTRPIHFRGVCTVVAKLFNIVQPDKAFFGEKDAQQLAIIRRMVRDMSYGIEIVGCPIVREDDGLAKSSRNTYLNTAERKAALCLSQSIVLGKSMISSGITSASEVTGKMREHIEKEPLAKIDYIEAVDALTMKPASEIRAGVLIAMAVYIGKTRLIDNFMVR